MNLKCNLCGNIDQNKFKVIRSDISLSKTYKKQTTTFMCKKCCFIGSKSEKFVFTNINGEDVYQDQSEKELRRREPNQCSCHHGCVQYAASSDCA